MATTHHLFLLAVAFFAVTHCTSAKTTRTATAVVINYTGAPIYAVSLIHKYSNDFESHHEYSRVRHGYRTTSRRGAVKYNTGFFTLGKDWWLVSWYNEKFTRQYYSNPNNFRGIIDGLESVAPSLVSAAAGAVAGVATAASGPGAIVAASVAAEAVATATSLVLFNSGTTAGFKQHILRKSDEKQLVRIYLYSNGRIRITSPSGTSHTVYSSIPTKHTTPQGPALQPPVAPPAPNAPPAAPALPAPLAQQAGCKNVSSGDAAVGISAVPDSRCPSFVGCLNDGTGCRFCKVSGVQTVQNMHLAAC